MVNKIAFLFLTIDNTRFPEIWEYYFKGNEDKINIYVHPKNKELVTDSFLRDNIIDDLRETSWARVFDASISLLKTALIDNDNKYFMIVSDSCLPIKSFDKFYNFVVDNKDLSYIDDNYYFTINEKESIDYLFKKHDIGKYFDREYNFKKHSAWWCLSRYLVKLIFKDKKINNDINKFRKIHSGDELWMSVFYPDHKDNLKSYSILYKNWENNVKAFKLTKEIKELWTKYDNCQDDNKKRNIFNEIRNKMKLRKEYGAHPKEYEEIDLDIIKEIENLDGFFLRKFSKDSNIMDYYKILLSND